MGTFTQLSGMENGAATVEDSIAGPQKVTYRITV